VSGPLLTFTMGGSDHPDHTVLACGLQDFSAGGNPAACRPI